MSVMMSFREILMVFTILLSSLGEAQKPEGPSAYLSNRSVEIEWDKVPGATQYDLEVYDGKQKKFIKSFSSKTNVFKLNVKMGTYYFRSRIFDKFERSSEWTELAELVIAPPPTKIKNNIPDNQQFYADKKSGFLGHFLSWDELPGISEYKLVMETPDGKLETETRVKGISRTLKVPSGQHRFRVQAILSDGTLGEFSEPTPVLSVLGAKIQKPTIVYKKNFSTPAESVALVRSELAMAEFDGELFYQPLEGTSWKRIQEFRNLKTNQILFNAEYFPGKYRLRMQAKAVGFTPSEFGVAEFTIKPSEVVITPIPDEVKVLTDKDRDIEPETRN